MATAELRYTLADVQRINDKLNHDPASLSDRDIAILASEDREWGSRSMHFAEKATKARAAALKAMAETARAELAAKAAAPPPVRKRRRAFPGKTFDRYEEAVIDYVCAESVDDSKELDEFSHSLVAAELSHETAFAVIPLVKCIRSLVRQIDEIKALPRGAVYKGTWQKALTYKRHDGVTWDGSFWTCIAETAETQPNLDPKSWQLSVKKGSDGKDAR